MALYYDAASILASSGTSGSLKSRVYSNTTLKSKPAQIYALISETAKRDVFLKEVLDNTDFLKDEPRLTPLLSLLLCHDHLFSKGGIAAPIKHPLRQAVERHKARLQSEFTRARLRRKCASIVALKETLDVEKGTKVKTHPRWARVNTIRAQDAEGVIRSLNSSTRKPDLGQVLQDTTTTSYCHDENVPDLFALSPHVDLVSTEAYKNGELILQDKASCFPAHLLLGDQNSEDIGDMIDGCAAPGNKTTHLAAIAHRLGVRGRIFACERDAVRSKTLQNMVAKAGANQVEVLARQDFLAIDPHDQKFARVTHLLLDPSCSGSGILGREDVPRLALPNDPRANLSKDVSKPTKPKPHSKKRKRNTEPESDTSTRPESTEVIPTAAPTEEAAPIPTTHDRLQKLSNLQTRIVEHAMKFPSARRITYSTCSIHEVENECVVSRVLRSDIARSGGWRVLERDRQVGGLRAWGNRGVRDVSDGGVAEEEEEEEEDDGDDENQLDETELQGCIRCSPDDGKGTMGFFVCGFERDGDTENVNGKENKNDGARLIDGQEVGNEGDDWEGFD